MGKKKKEIRIIKKDSNKDDYTFVSDNIFNKVNNIKNNESVINEKKLENKSDDRIEKKIYSKKSHHKGRKILGKSLQGHSPVYE